MFRPLLLAFALSVSAAQAAAPNIEAEEPQGLSDSQMAEVVDFVVGNAVFALYHQAGHMFMERYGLEAIGGEQAADDFSVMVLLEPRTGAGDQTLVDAIDSLMLLSPRTATTQPDSLGLPDKHSVDAPRASAIICDMVGSNPKDFADIADAAALSQSDRADCAASYAQKRAQWDRALEPLRRGSDKSLAPFPVAYEPPTGNEVAELTILHDNKVLEEVATRLAGDFDLANPPTLRAKSCGATTSSYDAARNEIVLCYELSSYHAELILRDLEAR